MIRSLVVAAGSRDIGPHRGFGREGHPRLWVLAVLGGLLLAGVVLLVAWLARRPTVRPPMSGPVPPVPPSAPMPPSPTASAEAILAERLARSEISPDDYRTLLAALREPLVAAGAPPSAPGPAAAGTAGEAPAG